MGLSVELLTYPWNRAPGSRKPSDPKEQGRNSSDYYDLVSEVTCCHFHHILFIRRRLLWLVHTQEEDVRILSFQGKIAKEFVEI